MVFDAVAPTPGEVAAARPGDDLVPEANVVMDRAFTIAAPVDAVWPWIEQLGKRRGGWYFPRGFERFIPRSRRGLWHLDPALALSVGDVIPDWGGAHATFEVAILERPTTLVHVSTRGSTHLSWAITLREDTEDTRVHLRLRLGGVKHAQVAGIAGGFFDWATILGLAAGLRQRVDDS